MTATLPRRLGPLSGWTLWGIAALVLSVVAGPALHFDFVHDDRVLLGTGRLADLRSFPAALGHDLFWLADGQVRPSPYWRPVVVATYYLEQAIGGGRPWVFHLGNLLALSGLAAVAAARVRDRLGQLLVIAILLLHPLQAEAAANITARTDTLAALFGTLALFHGSGLGAVLTLLALGSKEVAVVVPVLALLRARATGRTARAWLPHAVATAGWLVVRQVLVASWGVSPEDRAGPTIDSILGAGHRVAFYLGRLLWPAHPTPARTLPEVSGVEALAGWGLVVLLAAAIAWGLQSARRRVPGDRGGDPVPWPLALAVLVLPLLPVSGLLVGRVRYAEGFLVWPLVGAGWLLAGLPRGRGLLLGLLLPLAVPMRAQVSNWRDERTLWERAAGAYPDDPLVALKLARIRLGEGDAAGAEEAIEVALGGALPPRERREASAVGARLRLDRGDTAGALSLLVVAARPDDPEATWALTARCVIEVAEAVSLDAVSLDAVSLDAASVDSDVPLAEVCAEALRRSPEDPDLHNAVGILAARSGDLATARDRFATAVKLDPARPEFRANLERASR